MSIPVREHGVHGPLLVVVHGGPGAPGTIAPVARELAEGFRVLEPWQRRSGEQALTVARHVEDLDEVIASRCQGEKPSLIGHSWGAMLVLAYAAAHPEKVDSLLLVGCGTFDPDSRALLARILDSRMDASLRDRLDGLEEEVPDPDERLAALGDLLLPLYSNDLMGHDLELETGDMRGHLESWEDMVRLQEEGVYPAAFSAIEAPVLMVHGSHDPHPGKLIRESLAPHVPRLEYRELPRCGHYPWLERHARDAFFEIVRSWLEER